jgi:hypothetical protein
MAVYYCFIAGENARQNSVKQPDAVKRRIIVFPDHLYAMQLMLVINHRNSDRNNTIGCRNIAVIIPVMI